MSYVNGLREDLPSGKRVDWQRGVFWVSPLELIAAQVVCGIAGWCAVWLWRACQ